MGPPAFSTKVLILMKVETTLPLKKEARISNLQRMKALQAFNGVYSGLLTTILYYLQTKSLPDQTFSLTAYLRGFHVVPMLNKGSMPPNRVNFEAYIGASRLEMRSWANARDSENFESVFHSGVSV